MKTLTIIFTTWLLLLTPLSPALADTIYRWIDDKGQMHFSDKVPAGYRSIQYVGTALSNVTFVESKPNKTIQFKKRNRKNKSKSNPKSKISQCQRLKKSIASIEIKLKGHLPADKNDQFSHQLNQLRWQKIKRC